jgi:hypothetical protein
MLRALVLGDARSVHEDAARALALFTPDAIAATNNIGIQWEGRLDYWFTLHVEACTDWVGINEALRQRTLHGRNRPQIWSHRSKRHAQSPPVDRVTDDWGGSTGLLCVKALIEEGFTRIVLAGIPMAQDGGHFYDRRKWSESDRYHPAWQRNLAAIRDVTRSVSGWTAHILGQPTIEWLAGDEPLTTLAAACGAQPGGCPEVAQ